MLAFFVCSSAFAAGTLPAEKAAGKKPSQEMSVKQIFDRADAHFEKLASLSFNVERTMSRGLQKQEEKWKVFMQKPESIRIEYLGPPKRIVLSKADLYSEYIPQAKKALELKLSDLSTKSQEEVFSALMPRVAIPGFRVGITDSMMNNMDFQVIRKEEKSGRSAFLIQGKDRPKTLSTEGLGVQTQGNMSIWVDQERFTLLRVEVFDGKQFISSIENFGFQDLGHGIWLPNRIEVTNNNPKALEKATYRISNLVPNLRLDPKIFEAIYEEGVKVTRNDKKPTAKTP